MDSSKEGQARIQRILWLAFLPTPVILGVVSWIAARANRPEEGIGATVSFSDPLVFAFALIAIAIFLLAGRLSRILKPLILGSGSGDSTEQYAMVLLVVRCALFESVAILGFVLALLKGSVLPGIPFMFLSLAGLVFSRPSADGTA